MEKNIATKKKILKAVIWVVVVVILLATIHTLVNYFDLFEFVQKLHGG